MSMVRNGVGMRPWSAEQGQRNDSFLLGQDPVTGSFEASSHYQASLCSLKLAS